MTVDIRTFGVNPGFLLVQATARHEAPSLEEELSAIAAGTGVSFAMTLLEVDDWDVDLMPWPDRKISRDERAGKSAEATLQFVIDKILPQYPDIPVIIGGYSLAGLFALWASTKTDRFAGVAAASPSLWIAGWDEYAEGHPSLAKEVYLSLGDREEISRNSAIARVGERVRAQYGLLENQLGAEHCTLVWEEGNHFTDNAGRLSRAFIWTVRRISQV